ncbi:GTP-binding protein YcjX, partial [Pasteurella multocida]|uniref:YcjX family protein n=1 Tax=Pasteurella multocida TaxID=747 RepID=UPI0014612DBC|nr:GTP-binding protein YcjX [Pasteurella multocida]
QRYEYYRLLFLTAFYRFFFSTFFLQVILSACFSPLNHSQQAFLYFHFAFLLLFITFHYFHLSLFNLLFSPLFFILIFFSPNSYLITLDHFPYLLFFFRLLVPSLFLYVE